MADESSIVARLLAVHDFIRRKILISLHFASAVVAAKSLASWSDCRLPSDFVNEHMSAV